MTRFEIDFETALPPTEVIQALTNFTPQRPDIWPGLARQYYEVYSVGETSADVREGGTKPVKVWAKEHYDWSTPGTVTWTVKESDFCTPGSFVSVRADPSGAGGSKVHLTWERFPSNAKGRFIIAMMKLVGPKVIKSYSV